MIREQWFDAMDHRANVQGSSRHIGEGAVVIYLR